MKTESLRFLLLTVAIPIACGGEPTVQLRIDSVFGDVNVIGKSGLPIGSVFTVVVDDDQFGRLDSGIKLPVVTCPFVTLSESELPGKRFLAVEKFCVGGSPAVVTSQVVLVRLAKTMQPKTLPIVSKQYSIQQLGQPEVKLIGRMGVPLGTKATVEGKCTPNPVHPKRLVFEVSKVNDRPCSPQIFSVPAGIELEVGDKWQGKVVESASTGAIGSVWNEYEIRSHAQTNKSLVHIPYLIGGMVKFNQLNSHLTPAKD